MNSIHQMLLDFSEKVVDPQLLADGLSTGLNQFQDHVAELACQLFPALIARIDQSIVDHRTERKGWSVVQKGVSRTLQTTYGPLVFERRYYQHPDEGYAYLCDEVLAIEPYERIERGLALGLVTDAAEVSYAQSAARQAKGAVSRTSVMSLIRKLNLPPETYEERSGDVPIVHIQADEDHVHLQQSDKRSGIIRLIAIHEPKKAVSKDRYELTSRHLMARVDQTPQKVWEQVSDYLLSVYPNQEPQVFIHGDGDSWIESGTEEIPHSVAILDLFHLSKRIRGICQGDGALMQRIYQTLREDDPEGFGKEVEMLIDSAVCCAKDGRDFFRYVNTRWSAAVANFTLSEVHGGSCAEGLVSHVLSKRFSRHPMGWSMKSLKPLADMRARLQNGERFETTIFDPPPQAVKTSPRRMARQTQVGVEGLGVFAEAVGIPGSEQRGDFLHALAKLTKPKQWN